MRVLALDIGEKRTGLAISDGAGRVATPLAVVDTAAAIKDGAELARVLRDYDDIALVVVGLPLSLDGTQGRQAARVRSLAERLAARLPAPHVFADERLSSAEAERRMAEAGADSRRRRGSVDMVAAAVFLQTYLDSRMRTEGT